MHSLEPAARRIRTQAELLREMISAKVGGDINSVAVVGNAPAVPAPSRAQAIDSADVVVRMTTFDVDRGRPQYGRRTDVVVLHRATACGPATFEDYRQRLYLVAEPGRRHWEAEPVPASWPADLGAVHISNAEFVDELNRKLGFHPALPTWATTGTLATWVMHRVFPSATVGLTGTSLLDAGRRRRVLQHAWGRDVPLTSEHRLAAESRVLRTWVDDGWLRILS